MVTFKPRDSKSLPMEAEAMPLPKDETTPPVTKMYLVTNALQRYFHRGVAENGYRLKSLNRFFIFLCDLRVSAVNAFSLNTLPPSSRPRAHPPRWIRLS